MKKFLILSLLMIFVVALCAELLPQKVERVTADNSKTVRPQQRMQRDVPEWDWDVTPQALLTNYADYFQCYNQTPISLQTEDHGGGVYMMYRVKDNEGNSEVSYSYVDNTGNVVNSAGINSVGYYCDAQVDPQTGNVFGTWHLYMDDGTETYDCIAIYDMYSVINGPGLWKNPVMTALDSDAQDDLDPTANDEFIWPQIAIGPSPTPGKQRIYVVASNHIEADGTQNNPSENVMIMMADFDETDITLQSDLVWTYNSVPALDSWNAEDPYWYRPFKSFTVIDNQLIFMGYRIPGDALPDDPDELFCFVNDNYGEGDDWAEYYHPMAFEADNPTWEYNGQTWHLFADHPDYPSGEETVYVSVAHDLLHTGHFNLVPTHNNTCVTWAGAMGLTFDSGAGAGYYWPLRFMVYPKTFTFDLVNEEFSMCDVYPQGANPTDFIPVEPWDLDEDGEIDEFTPDDDPTQLEHYPIWHEDWPIFHYDTESAFHYNEYFLTTNNDQGWMAYIWVDGMMATAANEGWEGYEDWVATPEIAVCVSNDWGATWMDPIFINANPNSENYNDQLAEMIPCFAYPGDAIEDDGDGYGIVHLFFLDDNDYGSNHSQTHGLANGSTFEYASMRIYFGENSDETNDELASVPVLTKNYPNPFNPTTTISFQNQDAGNVTVDVYNVKGQLVRSLVNDYYEAGSHNVIWNGTDNNGNNAPSGVYFFKTKLGKYTSTKKMILMK